MFSNINNINIINLPKNFLDESYLLKFLFYRYIDISENLIYNDVFFN